MSFEKELEILLNKYSKETANNTPDFILAKYLNNCLDNFSETVSATSRWIAPTLKDDMSPSNDNNVIKLHPKPHNDDFDVDDGDIFA